MPLSWEDLMRGCAQDEVNPKTQNPNPTSKETDPIPQRTLPPCVGDFLLDGRLFTSPSSPALGWAIYGAATSTAKTRRLPSCTWPPRAQDLRLVERRPRSRYDAQPRLTRAM